MATLSSPLHPKALRYLAAVAQLGSVQAAAREVSISASAIDRQILMLERHGRAAVRAAAAQHAAHGSG